MAELRIPLIVELSMDGQKIIRVAEPTADSDAATKMYVDMVSGISTQHDFYTLVTDDDPSDTYTLDALNGIDNDELHAAGTLSTNQRVDIEPPLDTDGDGTFWFIINIDTSVFPIMPETSFRVGGFLVEPEVYGPPGGYQTFVFNFFNNVNSILIT